MIRRVFKTAPLFLTVAGLLAGCQTPPLYYWGHYEDIVYVSYADPAKLPVKQQIALMEEDLEKAQADKKPVPPGFHAQLGYLDAKNGNFDKAKSQFEAEKREFPESTTLMNRLIANMSRS